MLYVSDGCLWVRHQGLASKRLPYWPEILERLKVTVDNVSEADTAKLLGGR